MEVLHRIRVEDDIARTAVALQADVDMVCVHAAGIGFLRCTIDLVPVLVTAWRVNQYSDDLELVANAILDAGLIPERIELTVELDSPIPVSVGVSALMTRAQFEEVPSGASKPEPLRLVDRASVVRSRAAGGGQSAHSNVVTGVENSRIRPGRVVPSVRVAVEAGSSDWAWQ